MIVKSKEEQKRMCERIVKLAAEGLSNKVIASRVGVSDRQVARIVNSRKDKECEVSHGKDDSSAR